jgi:regulator of sigma E protease
MEILIKAIQLLMSLSLLVILHEFGHYLPAKLFKTRVEKFYLFFDYKFSIFKKKIGDTVYGIGWIPLGGYVKISGMVDESMDTEQLKQPPQPWEFRSKPAWQRLIIMLGGVTVNFLLALVIYIAMTYVWGVQVLKPSDVKHGFAVDSTFVKYGFENGDKILKINNVTPENALTINKNLLLRSVKSIQVEHANGIQETIDLPKNIDNIMWKSGVLEPFKPRVLAVIDSVLNDSPAGISGMEKGDKIVSVNNEPVKFWGELIAATKDKENITINVLRSKEERSILINKQKDSMLGVSFDNRASISYATHMPSFGKSIVIGSERTYWSLKDFISQFKFVFTEKGAQNLGGFIAIGNIFPSSWSWESFWGITAFLSVMLGFMNLLPIPALDGGHALFTIIEMITRRKPSDKFMEYAQLTGFVILICLVLFANVNDVIKLFR